MGQGGSLAGRVAPVTGAAGGIGSAVCRAFAAAGADLALLDTAPPDALADELVAFGRRRLTLGADVTRRAASIDAVAQTTDAYGRLDILVNVAGVVSFGPAATLDAAEWDRVIDTNLKGTFLFCQAAIPAMRAQNWGRIINLGSVIGKNGGNARPWIDLAEQDRSSNVAYGVSKAGGACADLLPGARAGDQRHHRQRGRAGPDRVRRDCQPAAEPAGADPGGADGPVGGRGQCRAVPRRRGRVRRHRRDPGRQRRHVGR